MTAQNRTTIKTYFQTGDKPDQTQFANLIDSYLSLADTGLQIISSPLTVSGAVVLDSSLAVATTLVVSGATTLANNLTVTGSAATSLTGNLTIGGALSVGGNISFAGGLIVPGSAATALSGNLVVSGVATLAGGGTTVSANPLNNSITIANTNYVDSATKCILISAQSVTGATSVDFTTIANTSYDHYEIVLDNVVPGTGAVDLFLIFSQGGVFDTGGHYSYQTFRFTSSATGINGSTTDNQFVVSTNTETLSTSQAISVKICIFNTANGAAIKRITYEGDGAFTSGNVVGFRGGGIYNPGNSTNVDGFRVKCSTGVISCTARLYGYKNS